MKKYRFEMAETSWFEENIACQSACPAGTDACGYISEIVEQRFDNAFAINKRDNILPATLGRVCFHPCEDACRRKWTIDQAVAICALKRHAADNISSHPDTIPYYDERTPAHAVTRDGMLRTVAVERPKIAIIGAGPAGLAAAHDLALNGYHPVIFEKYPVAGGMMAVGIPEYRLPRTILQSEIDAIKKLGVEIRLNVEIGKDVYFSELRTDYKAIFIGAGCHQGLKMNIPGEDDFKDVIDCTTFLREINLERPPIAAQKLFVIGGGNAAIDCARVAYRLGYDEVSILYRRTRAEMPASPEEVQGALEEGIDIQFLTTPVKILGADSHINAVECIRMELGEPDKSGRRRPKPVKNSEFTMEADAVVIAIGQKPKMNFLSAGDGVKLGWNNLIDANLSTGATNMPGVFAGGDVVSGPSSVIEAVAIGKRAAVAIDRYIKKEAAFTTAKDTPPVVLEPVRVNRADDNYESVKRAAHNTVDAERRVELTTEVELGFAQDNALEEARRCLKCNFNICLDHSKCVLCGGCADVCPLNCIDIIAMAEIEASSDDSDFYIHAEPSEQFVLTLDEDRCIRCALCVQRCPVGALAMGELKSDLAA